MLSGQNASLKANNWSRHPMHKRKAAYVWLVMALLVAHSGGNVPAWLVFTFQAARRTFLFPVRPIAHEKRRNVT